MFKPLKNRLLIKRLNEEEKTAGGLIVPDIAKEKPAKGEVVAVGKGQATPEGKILPMDIKLGDIVLFEKWSGNEIKIEDEDYVIVKEDDVLGIF